MFLTIEQNLLLFFIPEFYFVCRIIFVSLLFEFSRFVYESHVKGNACTVNLIQRFNFTDCKSKHITHTQKNNKWINISEKRKFQRTNERIWMDSFINKLHWIIWCPRARNYSIRSCTFRHKKSSMQTIFWQKDDSFKRVFEMVKWRSVNLEMFKEKHMRKFYCQHRSKHNQEIKSF